MTPREFILKHYQELFSHGSPDEYMTEHRLYLYFDPPQGIFIYMDTALPHQDVVQMIDRGEASFDRVAVHQGTLMLRYNLNLPLEGHIEP